LEDLFFHIVGRWTSPLKWPRKADPTSWSVGLVGNVIIPTDELIVFGCFRGRSTTNQMGFPWISRVFLGGGDFTTQFVLGIDPGCMGIPVTSMKWNDRGERGSGFIMFLHSKKCSHHMTCDEKCLMRRTG
jgi:hypothetical protein